VHVTVLKEIPEDPALGKAWNVLVQRMHEPEVFFTYQWALAVSRAFQSQLSPLLFLMYDSGQLAGVAALATDSDNSTTAFFLNASTADYCDIVSAPANRGAVIVALLEELQKLGITELILANVSSSSATIQEMASAAKLRRFYLTSRVAYTCGVVRLEDEEQRKSLVKTLASKEREKRGLKKLRSLGSVSVSHLTKPDQVGPGLEAIVSAQISRFLASNRVSPLLTPERRAFLRHLGELLSDSGWLTISQLEIDARPIAWNYGFRFAGSWFWYLPAFQIEYEHLSPGSCLLRLLVEEGARDSSLKWFDLGLGGEAYKERFANHIRQTSYIHLSRSYPKHLAGVGRQMVTGAANRFPEFADKVRDARALGQAAVRRFSDMGVRETVRRVVRKTVKPLASQDESLFFEYPAREKPEQPGVQLLPLTQERMVEASILHAEDAHTLHYLMRCARRLNKPGPSGFVMHDEAGRSIHFLWIDNYDGFHVSEIDHILESSSENRAVIFDCWTPSADRGRGHYASAIRQAADTLLRENRAPWIFCGAGNTSSVRGIWKAGFAYRFSLVRRRRLGSSVVTRQGTSSAALVSAALPASPQNVSRDSKDVAGGRP
jgi:CelD/BcsL family acetyltransferase involved in cellulose biosynthesis